MAMNSQTLDDGPWYRQGWPWFLFGLPAISVVVCTALYIIANYWNVDSLVTDDIYKDGKGIEILIGRREHAQSLGLSAYASVRESSISIKMSAAQKKDLPAAIRLVIIHPTRDKFDQHVLLQKEQDDVYSGPIKPLHASRWLFQLEDESQAWRMTGEANIPTEMEVLIEPFLSNRVNQTESTKPSDS
jgi:hypothetical protein